MLRIPAFVLAGSSPAWAPFVLVPVLGLCVVMGLVVTLAPLFKKKKKDEE